MIISVIYKELTDFRAARKGENNDVKEGIEE